jgi:hypothetical protein
VINAKENVSSRKVSKFFKKIGGKKKEEMKNIFQRRDKEI